MKGGILLAIRYGTGRFTKDVDFLTTQSFKEFDEERFLDAFRKSLIQASSHLPYQLECCLQRQEIRPNRDGSFPTMKMSVGYASKTDRRVFERLLKGQAPAVVEIDYSFNDGIHDIDIINVDRDMNVQAYGKTTLIAEKFRAILQQVVRQRSRRQDIFDLYYLFSHYPLDARRKPQILEALISKCRSRNIEATAKSMAANDI